jgi:hypothetical protein
MRVYLAIVAGVFATLCVVCEVGSQACTFFLVIGSFTNPRATLKPQPRAERPHPHRDRLQCNPLLNIHFEDRSMFGEEPVLSLLTFSLDFVRDGIVARFRPFFS